MEMKVTEVNTCHELIDALSRAETVEDIHDVCSQLCERFGFDHFIYGAGIPTSFVKPYFIYVSGYPTEWRARYSAEGYMSIDPTVIYCSSHLTPLDWSRISLEAERDEIAKRFMGEAREFGLISGVSLPIHTAHGESAMMSLASGQDYVRTKARIRAAMPHAQLFTAYLHEAVRRIFDCEILPLAEVRLTEREKECLLWAAEGKTAWETARILNVSERTVTYHVQNAATKLQVVNRQQAVARAVSFGLIKPQLG